MSELQAAAYNADLAAVTRLLCEGVSVDARDVFGFTALLWTCFMGAVGDQAPVVDALLKAGADVEAVTAQSDSSCLMLAAQSGSVPVIQALIAAGAVVD